MLINIVKYGKVKIEYVIWVGLKEVSGRFLDERRLFFSFWFLLLCNLMFILVFKCCEKVILFSE